MFTVDLGEGEIIERQDKRECKEMARVIHSKLTKEEFMKLFSLMDYRKGGIFEAINDLALELLPRQGII